MAYTVSDLTSAVRDDLKDSSFSSARILRYLNRAQQVVFNTRYFKFCEKAFTDTLNQGDFYITEESDHQATIGGALIDSDDLTRFTFTQDNYLPHREFFASFPAPDNETENVPAYWTEYGQLIYFSCPLDDDYSLRLRYYRWPDELDGDNDVPTVPEPFREALELFCLYRAEKYRGNHDVAATYKQDFEDELEAMAMRYSAPTQVSASRVVQRRVRTGDY